MISFLSSYKKGDSEESPFLTTVLSRDCFPEIPCARVHAKQRQSCPTLCDPMDCSLPGSSVHGILQARTLEWVAMPFSRGSFPTQELSLGLLHCRQILYTHVHTNRHVFSHSFHYQSRCLIVYIELYVDCCSQQVGPCYLPFLYVVVCICSSQTPNLSLPSPSPFGDHKFVFYVCESVSIL